VRKLRFVGHRGAPDQAVMSNGRTIYIELKAPGKTVPAYQLREHQRLRNVGQIVLVIDSFELVDEFIEEYFDGEESKTNRARSNIKLSC
tara:strand:+ start:448 stop:714 length:267 start_codon:yes stop_codon:yes gene_type:complete